MDQRPWTNAPQRSHRDGCPGMETRPGGVHQAPPATGSPLPGQAGGPVAAIAMTAAPSPGWDSPSVQKGSARGVVN